jgi:hypothetical protein
MPSPNTSLSKMTDAEFAAALKANGSVSSTRRLKTQLAGAPASVGEQCSGDGR